MSDQEASYSNVENPSDPNQYSDPVPVSGINSIKDLIKVVTGKDLEDTSPSADYGFADKVAFPFSAIVGQQEMKLALILSLINPLIGGVLLVGPRGTGKTTSVRSLVQLLPMVEKSSCFYGCTEEDLLSAGTDAVCSDCAQKFARNEPLTHMELMRLVELPLNATIDDVIGQLDDNLPPDHPMRFKRGILTRADKNILLVDEINLLNDEILDAILDASAYGSYTVRRGSLTANMKSRLTMIGTMNPQEGMLRPQILDRFGLRVFARPLSSVDERLLAYQRSQIYRSYPHHVIKEFEQETTKLASDIANAQRLVEDMVISDPIAKAGIALITELNIPSIRAEISLFEAAKAHAAADNRDTVTEEDIKAVAIISLRLRNSISPNIDESMLDEEDQKIHTAIESIFN